MSMPSQLPLRIVSRKTVLSFIPLLLRQQQSLSVSQFLLSTSSSFELPISTSLLYNTKKIIQKNCFYPKLFGKHTLTFCSSSSSLSSRVTVEMVNVVTPVVPTSTAVQVPTLLMPQLPYKYSSNEPTTASTDSSTTARCGGWDISILGIKSKNDEIQRQNDIEISRKFNSILIQIRSMIGTKQAKEQLDSILVDPMFRPYIMVQQEQGNDINDDGNKNGASTNDCIDKQHAHQQKKSRASSSSSSGIKIEEYIRLQAYQHFLTTSTLLMPNHVLDYATDEDYIIGCCIGLCQELVPYALGRATIRDVASVQAATSIVQDIHDYLIQFDFRNGPIRRKYDSIKYCLKDLETLLYELSITGATPITVETQPHTQSTKTTTPPVVNDTDPTNSPMFVLLSSSPRIADPNQLIQLQQRISFRDELREVLIKKARDGQKAAKNSIYAIHRKMKYDAYKLMDTCYNNICNELIPIIEQDDSVRTSCGSYSAVVEEYVEAMLFATWLYGRRTNDDDCFTAATTTSGSSAVQKDDNKSKHPDGTILNYEELIQNHHHSSTSTSFPIIDIDDYLGGLCDVTGEINRYAITNYGIKHDSVGVQQCLATNMYIYEQIQLHFNHRLPNTVYKKIDTVKSSIIKLQRMLYELSLSNAVGGVRTVQTTIDVGKVIPNDDGHHHSNDEE